MQKKLLRIVCIILASLLMIYPLTGCSSTQNRSDVLNVSLQTTAQGVPAYAAQTDGLNESVGLEVNFTVYSNGPSQNEALGANEWDVATMGSPPAIMANIAYGAKIIAFVLMEASTEFWVRPDSDIAQISGEVEGYPTILGNAETWRGKTILCPVATTSHFILLTLLELMGLTEDDVNIINMEVGQAYTAFKAGQGDIVTLWDPISFSAADEGWIRAAYGPDIPAYAPCVLVASQKAIEEKPELIQKWVDTYFDAVENRSDGNSYLARHAYALLNDNNVIVTEDESIEFVERKKFFTRAESLAFFESEDGNSLAWQYINEIIAFFVSQGSISQEEWNSIKDEGIFDTRFLLSAQENTG
ncbi:MAG: ABC transporter substrate-binding protein [Clostridiales bacterium]|nr:ABC transporter substrate-binding protein [Clostridiales bacterium]